MAAIQGFFTDFQHNTWLNQLFCGASYTAPTTLYVGLSRARSSRAGVVSEPAGGAYARVATTAATWRAAANGATNNTQAIAFAAPTGDWGTIVSVFLSDAASGGNVLAAADLAVPRTVHAGDPAKTFAAGALYVSRS